MRLNTPAIHLVILGMTLFSCTIVKNDAASPKNTGDTDFFFANSGFDPDALVLEIWDSKVLPNLEQQSHCLRTVLDAMEESQELAGKEYGYRIGDEGAYYNFVVNTLAKPLRIDTDSRNGLAWLDIEPFDGEEDVIMQIGPVIKGSSIRDNLKFISLNNFDNQVDFARFASSLNNKVKDSVLNNIQMETLTEQTINITATFTLDDSASLPVLTPVKLLLTEE